MLKYLSPKLTHSPWYDGHVDCNALALLDYSLDKPEQGINCLNKAKILEEVCLALGNLRTAGALPALFSLRF